MRELPTALYPDEKQGVTLKCEKLREAVPMSSFYSI